MARVERAVPWCPGARELLVALHEAEVPLALVTMSYARFVAPILQQLPPETFSVIVTGDQVANGKPHPEPYLTAAAALGVPPAECVAIEDSLTGLGAAVASGAAAIGVPHQLELDPAAP